MRLGPGDTAPAFSLTDQQGSTVKSSTLFSHPTILYAYPAAMTPGCTTQACDFRDNLTAFTGAGFTVVGISPDLPAKLEQFTENDALPFTLLSDPDHSVMEAYGAWGEKKLYGKVVTGVIRSTFIIAKGGTIEHAFYNVKATGHVAKLMRDLDL